MVSNMNFTDSNDQLAMDLSDHTWTKTIYWFHLTPTPYFHWMASLSYIGIIPAPWATSPAHQHPMWEVVQYLTGTGTVMVGDVPIVFQPGAIVCLPPNVPHAEESESGFTNVHMLFEDFHPPTRGIPVFTDDADRSFFQVAMQLHREFQIKGSRWQLLCGSLSEVLLRYLERWSAAEAPDQLVDHLQRELLAHMHEPDFSVGGALASLGCTADHARRVFHGVTGMTPLAYLIDLRIREAKQQLAAGIPVQVVAERVGFADPFYFSRVFRRSTGLSPKRWLAKRR